MTGLTGRARRLVRKLDRGNDRGQTSVEFLGMLPLILLTLVLIWQVVLVGYTYTLAGNAADEAVRAGTADPEPDWQEHCSHAGTDELPSGWKGSADVDCSSDGEWSTAAVHLKVPVLFPGAVDFPWGTITGDAGAPEEGD